MYNKNFIKVPDDSFNDVNRVELIDNTGRKYVKYDVEHVEIQLQDDGKTLKVFVKYIPEEEISND